MNKQEVLAAINDLQRQCEDKIVSTILVSVMGAMVHGRTVALMDHVNAFALAELEQSRRDRLQRN
jgi:hypothetical protein